ncbi:MAG TPA: magnesium/cobalt transporter CorA [Acidimicrobiales bacterium]|nr:magnesium/cobalt transporter CorA [Acidimicrobiales bacterium]
MPVRALLDEPKVCWIDVVDATPDEIAELTTKYHLDAMAVEDINEPGQRPKLELYPHHAFLVAYSANLAEVDVFIGDDWVITVRERNRNGDVWEPAPARTRCDRVEPGVRGIGIVVHAILDEIVDGYFDRLDAVEDRIEDLENDVFEPPRGMTETQIQQRLFDIRHELVAFRRKVIPLREVLAALLRGEVPALTGPLLPLLQDVFDHLLRAVDTIDSHRELMGNAVDAHLAIISNRMNEVMKLMTSWGAILLGSTLVAGIYGMNFLHMPELRWRYGYEYALGLMVVITVVGYWYFRRRDWL